MNFIRVIVIGAAATCIAWGAASKTLRPVDKGNNAAGSPEAGRSGAESSAEDRQTRANLAALRTAIALYCGETNGNFPSYIDRELMPKYFKTMPPCFCSPYHEAAAGIRTIRRTLGKTSDAFLKDSGRWLYIADPESDEFGNILVDCAHTDSAGTVWNRY